MIAYARRFTIVVFASSVLLATAAFGQKATLSAEIKGADGRPANAAEIRIERQGGKMAPIVARTDSRGKWSASNLPAGTYKVTTVVAGGAQSSQIVQALANKKILVTFDLKRAAGQSATAAPVRKKTYVWVETTTGTHMGGHFEEMGSAPTRVGPHVSVEGMDSENLGRIGRTPGVVPRVGGL